MPIRHTLVIHGGAGTLRPEAMAGREAAFHAGLREALAAGHAVLQAGGTALDAVTQAVMALEDDASFNAGRGSVFTAAGRHEMDAAVMDGASGQAGAVAGVCGPRHPVLAARCVMERSDSVLLAGEGALGFCRAHGLEWQEQAWFGTDARRAALAAVLGDRDTGGPGPDDFDRHGTVGAVACDSAGRLAAATSTGGMTAKPPGRIGDSPLPGSGTWADRHCAISCTGHGESFIRRAVAHEISARMRWAGQTLVHAADGVVAELPLPQAAGGLIAVGADGSWAMPFNTRGMYRGVVTGDGTLETSIYADRTG